MGEQTLKSRFETITVPKTGLWTRCQRCLHEWLYSGTRTFANCPMCHTTVTLNLMKGHHKKDKAGGQEQ